MSAHSLPWLRSPSVLRSRLAPLRASAPSTRRHLATRQTVIIPSSSTSSAITPDFTTFPLEATTPIPPPPPAPEPASTIEPSPLLSRVQRPIGAFRGGLIGFLLGMTAVGAWGYVHLLDDYTQASSALLESVEDLKLSTEKMTSHIQRIERVEKTVNELSKTSSTQQEVDGLRAEYRKLLEAEHLEVLALKSHVWGIEQDLQALTRGASTSVRI